MFRYFFVVFYAALVSVCVDYGVTSASDSDGNPARAKSLSARDKANDARAKARQQAGALPPYIRLKRKVIEDVSEPESEKSWSGRLHLKNIDVRAGRLIGNVHLEDVQAHTLNIHGMLEQGHAVKFENLHVKGGSALSHSHGGYAQIDGRCWMKHSRLKGIEVKGFCSLSHVHANEVIFTGKYLVLDDVNVKYVFVLVAGDALPRVFI